jgi:TetR/AcrR family transcriptional regulator, transcriptional repressor of aconitase
VSRKRTAADDSVRRAAIVTAARWCFLHFGYGKTSLEDIAKRASISRPLLYLTFKNKEQIFGAVFEDVFEPRYPIAERAIAAAGGKPERLMAACEILVVEPLSELAASPMGAEFLEACNALAPEIEGAYRKRVLRCVQGVLGDKALAEVFLLALDGLLADLPAVATLRRRVRLLVDRFAA